MAKRKRKPPQRRQPKPIVTIRATDEASLTPGLKTLHQRLKQEHGTAPVIADAADGVAMSEVLRDFIAPLHDGGIDFENFRLLLRVGVIAWNATLLPEQARISAMQAMAEAVTDDDARETFDTVKFLMLRKAHHFARYRRQIVDFELTDAGDEWRIAVVSTPPPDP